MKNKLLHALSNRPGPFNTGVFGSSRDFVPRRIPHGEQAIRDALFLDNTSTDYYLRSYLATVMAHPDMWRMIGDRPTTYKMTDFMPKGVRIDGADFASTSSDYGKFTDPMPDKFPVNLTYTIDYVNASMCRITGVEHGKQELAEVLVSILPIAPISKIISYSNPLTLVNESGKPITTEDGQALLVEGWFPKVMSANVYSKVTDQLIRISWPDGFPFSGPMVLAQTWTDNARIVIEVEPSRLPYRDIVTKLLNIPQTMMLLGQLRWIDEFVSAPSYAEKLSMVLTMLALKNLLRKTP